MELGATNNYCFPYRSTESGDMFLALSQGRAAASEETGTIRAKAVRIRGSPESAYPFMKGSPAPRRDLNLKSHCYQ